MPTIRISEPTREALWKLAEESAESMQALLEKAVEAYRRQHFLEETNRAFEALRASPQEWKSEQAEREEWDFTLADGLAEE